MKTLIVKLWGEEIGRLALIPSENLIQFVFNPKLKDRPDFAPLLCPVGKWNPLFPFISERDRLYQGLPPFIADSLPDSWGNSLFEKWRKKHKISITKDSPLFKLAFIGRRGMGALEYEPCATELEYSKDISLKDLYSCSLDIALERESVIENIEDITFETLIAVGTSAGGRQMKAVIAINHQTGEIRSGQIAGLEGFEYYIIKFEDNLVPSTEIEMAYYEMASSAGINMEECRILTIDGKDHFLTKRFDRRNGQKIHMQTLAAIDPEVRSYNELFNTCRKLGLSETEIAQLYRRMVFNILANNTDDHIKNFSFLLEKGGSWKLSPAYDLTFIFNKYGTGPELGQCISLYGKFDGITKQDLIEFAKENNIRGAEKIIAGVAEAIKTFPSLADKYHITDKWRFIIEHTLRQHLRDFGYLEESDETAGAVLTDDRGRQIRDFKISINTTGMFVVEAIIDGERKRRFVRKNMPEHADLTRLDIFALSPTEKLSLTSALLQ